MRPPLTTFLIWPPVASTKNSWLIVGLTPALPPPLVPQLPCPGCAWSHLWQPGGPESPSSQTVQLPRPPGCVFDPQVLQRPYEGHDSQVFKNLPASQYSPSSHGFEGPHAAAVARHAAAKSSAAQADGRIARAATQPLGNKLLRLPAALQQARQQPAAAPARAAAARPAPAAAGRTVRLNSLRLTTS